MFEVALSFQIQVQKFGGQMEDVGGYPGEFGGLRPDAEDQMKDTGGWKEQTADQWRQFGDQDDIEGRREDSVDLEDIGGYWRVDLEVHQV